MEKELVKPIRQHNPHHYVMKKDYYEWLNRRHPQRKEEWVKLMRRILMDVTFIHDKQVYRMKLTPFSRYDETNVYWVRIYIEGEMIKNSIIRGYSSFYRFQTYFEFHYGHLLYDIILKMNLMSVDELVPYIESDILYIPPYFGERTEWDVTGGCYDYYID